MARREVAGRGDKGEIKKMEKEGGEAGGGGVRGK